MVERDAAASTAIALYHVSPEDFPNLPALRAGFELEQTAWQALLGGLSADDIAADVHLTTAWGESAILPRWRIFNTWCCTACSIIPSWRSY